MPTGLNAGIANGNVRNAAMFARICAPSLGVLGGFSKEGEMPVVVEADLEFETKLEAKASAELVYLGQADRDLLLADHAEAVTNWDRQIANDRAQNERIVSAFQKILAETEAWIPPYTDDLIALRKLMIQQLEDGIAEHSDVEHWPILPFQKWVENRRSEAERDLVYAADRRAAKIARAAKANAFIALLDSSLPMWFR